MSPATMSLVVLALVLTIIMVFMSSIGWSVHIDMTRKNTKTHGWGNFNDFLKMIEKGNWEEREEAAFCDSLFAKNKDDYYNWKVHADILIFDGKGMILRFIPYLKYVMWKRNLERKKRNFKKINW